MPYPDTRTVDQVDEFFSTPVADPYRWLENSAEPEVTTWLAAQAECAREHLDTLPGRAAITAALDTAVRLPHSGLPMHRGQHWFRTANDGVQQQDVLLVADEPFGTGHVLIDPNQLDDGASTSLAAWQPSPDGSLVAYSYSAAGSDWRTWRVRDVATGADLPDVVEWSKFSWPDWWATVSSMPASIRPAPTSTSPVTTRNACRCIGSAPRRARTSSCSRSPASLTSPPGRRSPRTITGWSSSARRAPSGRHGCGCAISRPPATPSDRSSRPPTRAGS